MAPFVARQYGPELYAIMREIKRAFDPAGILNPDTVLTDDADLHLRNLKSTPTVEAEVDRCVECGYCEPVCPSKDLTTTPRQRIVVRRAIAEADARGDIDLSKELRREQEYEVVDTLRRRRDVPDRVSGTDQHGRPRPSAAFRDRRSRRTRRVEHCGQGLGGHDPHRVHRPERGIRSSRPGDRGAEQGGSRRSRPRHASALVAGPAQGRKATPDGTSRLEHCRGLRRLLPGVRRHHVRVGREGTGRGGCVRVPCSQGRHRADPARRDRRTLLRHALEVEGHPGRLRGHGHADHGGAVDRLRSRRAAHRLRQLVVL